jgi:hypothetical protein
MWRLLRIAVLALVLVLVSVGTLLDRWRTTDWDRPLRVGVFPIAADGRRATRDYVAGLGIAQFAPIGSFLEREARHWGLPLRRPVELTLHPPPREAPPLLERDAGPLATMAWSLCLRWYNRRVGGASGEQIRLYVLYHDPEVTRAVPHSLGLQKGLVGVVYAYAADELDGRNNIVIAHELLHTVGATDKYDPSTNLPRYPDGYAEPAAEPRHPQDHAELMAGRRALDADEAEMPPSLDAVVIGEATAREVRWLREP